MTPRQLGRLDLAIAAAPAGSLARRALAVPPLQLSRLRRDFSAWPSAASFTLVHLGGVLDGDCYQLAIDLDAATAAHITSAAATLAHPARERPATLTLSIRLGAGARLAYLPLPLILFRDADLSQQVFVSLAPGALLLLIDVVAMGRRATGEHLRFRRYQSRLEVADDQGALLFAERSDLQPAHMPLAAPGLLGDKAAVGSLYLLAPGSVAKNREADLWELLAAHQLDGAVGQLPNGAGLLLRALADDALALWRALDAIAHHLAPAFDLPSPLAVRVAQ